MSKAKRTMLWIFFLLVACIQLFPLVWLIDFSLADSSEFFSDKVLVWPETLKWQNYTNAWVDGEFVRYLINSVLVSVVTIAYNYSDLHVYGLCVYENGMEMADILLCGHFDRYHDPDPRDAITELFDL